MKPPIKIERERYKVAFCRPDITTSIRLCGRQVFYSMHNRESGWFRLFGYGISWKDSRHCILLFSERHGDKKLLKIGPYRFSFLGPQKPIAPITKQPAAKTVRVETNELILAEQKEIDKLMNQGYTEAQAKQMRLHAAIDEHPEIFKEMQDARPVRPGDTRIGSYIRRKKRH